MKTVNSTLKFIKSMLSNSLMFNGVSVLYEFPGIRKDIPLITATVAVGLESAKITASEKLPIGFGALLSIVNIKISICVPKSFGGNMCLDLFEKVIGVISATSVPSIIGVNCGNVEYSRNLGGFVMPVVLTISDWMYD